MKAIAGRSRHGDRLVTQPLRRQHIRNVWQSMSYDIYLNDPVTGKVIDFGARHQIDGGTCAMGGTSEAWLNVTYNYCQHFRRVLGDKGIRSIYGKSGAESLPMLKAGAEALDNDVDEDYWKPTEGNAKRALLGLVAFAQLRPDGIWDGD
jgi:hypothetical protein